MFFAYIIFKTGAEWLSNAGNSTFLLNGIKLKGKHNPSKIFTMRLVCNSVLSPVPFPFLNSFTGIFLKRLPVIVSAEEAKSKLRKMRIHIVIFKKPFFMLQGFVKLRTERQEYFTDQTK